MIKKTLVMPKEIHFISEWLDFGNYIPEGKVILDKAICGCGCTEFFLNSSNAVILVSPRRELINCKMNSDIERPYPLHYFDRSKNTKKEKTIEQLNTYINEVREHSKILVTYDSLSIVLDLLSNIGLLNNFNIVVDEFTSIFTDVKLKGNIELNLINRLQKLPNSVVYISATPISEKYLNELDEFKNTTYMELKWDPTRTETVFIDTHYMYSTDSAIQEIIDRFKSCGYFGIPETVEGRLVQSTEAVFFLNNVNAIKRIIQKCKLTSADTLVICAMDKNNKEKLAEVGFEIGHVPNRKEYKIKNKTYTFVTKASFEGVDFYSDCSTSYIFADSNLENMALDISIDIPQIIGRCRCENNPFRNVVKYYYKTNGIDTSNYEEAKRLVNRRMETTDKALKELEKITCESTLKKLLRGQEDYHYKDDYVDVDKEMSRCVCNKLAWLADIRAIDIKYNQYKTICTVMSHIERKGYSLAGSVKISDRIQQFLNEFHRDKLFTRRMKLYCDIIEENNEFKTQLEALHEIPFNIKQYYNELGPVIIKALEYRETYLDNEIRNKIKIETIYTLINGKFQPGIFYSNKEVKEILQQLYDEEGITKHAKATDIEQYLPNLKSRITTVKGKSVRGYKF